MQKSRKRIPDKKKFFDFPQYDWESTNEYERETNREAEKEHWKDRRKERKKGQTERRSAVI